MGAIGAVSLIVLGAHQHAPWLVAAAFIGGPGSSVLGIGWDTSPQEHVPENALSHVSSYDNLLSCLSIPIDQLCVSPLAHTFGGFRGPGRWRPPCRRGYSLLGLLLRRPSVAARSGWCTSQTPGHRTEQRDGQGAMRMSLSCGGVPWRRRDLNPQPSPCKT